MLRKFVTIDVSKFDIFNEVNETQSENILWAFIRFGVLKLDKSNEISDEQFENILYI